MTRETTTARQEAWREYALNEEERAEEERLKSARTESIESQIGLYYSDRCLNCDVFKKGNMVNCVLLKERYCSASSLKITAENKKSGWVSIRPLISGVATFERRAI